MRAALYIKFSLRLGHARGLTVLRTVIQHPHAANATPHIAKPHTEWFVFMVIFMG